MHATHCGAAEGRAGVQESALTANAEQGTGRCRVMQSAVGQPRQRTCASNPEHRGETERRLFTACAAVPGWAACGASRRFAAPFNCSRARPPKHLVVWPSGLRRLFKAQVFGRGFESHSDHFFFLLLLLLLRCCCLCRQLYSARIHRSLRERQERTVSGMRHKSSSPRFAAPRAPLRLALPPAARTLAIASR